MGVTDISIERAPAPVRHSDEWFAAMEAIQRRVLWLATRMIDHANHGRPQGEVKVGGHQASSASMVSLMTALWFGVLDANDKVAVKPHASPAFHAIKYLIGELDHRYLTTLREYGGLQAYPSRTKDPDVADFSTGSVGLGAVAPLFAAATARYLGDRFDTADQGRFISLVGDAELDEGNVWEAVADPALEGLGRVMMVVDANRQSLDRVVPGIRILGLKERFAAAGWHVVEAKYGRRLQDAFDAPGGERLRLFIDNLSNESYQELIRLPASELRAELLAAEPELEPLADLITSELLQDLGGHDLATLLDCFAACDAEVERPSVLFAYTIKGWGLPFAGDPLNHAAILSRDQIDQLRSDCGLDEFTEWDRFASLSPEALLCEEVGRRLVNRMPAPRPRLAVPTEVGIPSSTRQSTQDAFGRTMQRLAGTDVASRLVTVAPDVAISTSLGGWINRVGVYDPHRRASKSRTSQAVAWEPSPEGQHIELGISEMNLFSFLGQLGLSHEHHGEVLLPVGSVYDPFVCRGLDALIYGLYNDARFVFAGTPSGVTLAPEGGAHQSSITPSIGLELPNLDLVEPAFAKATEWLLCDALAGLVGDEPRSAYLRLSTRPIDQGPFEEAMARRGAEAMRVDVLRGGYRIIDSWQPGSPHVNLLGSGAVLPEVLDAAEALLEEGVTTTVIDVTSQDRLYADWQSWLRGAIRSARVEPPHFHLAGLLGARRAPIVTVHDAATHSMAWMGAASGQPVVPVGVDDFGQSGSIEDLYGHFGLDSGHIVNAALLALQLAR